MFIQIGDQQIGWIKGGLFMLGRTAFRPPLGAYAPQDEIRFLERYLHQLELELADVDRRLDQIAADRSQPPAHEPPSLPDRETATSMH